MRFNTFIAGKFRNADGAIETRGNEIIVFRKSPFTRALFGLIGTALASGKEVGRFTAKDISSYRTEQKGARTCALFTFKDGSAFSFTMKGDTVEAFESFMMNSFFSCLEEGAGDEAPAASSDSRMADPAPVNARPVNPYPQSPYPVNPYPQNAAWNNGYAQPVAPPRQNRQLIVIAAICFAVSLLYNIYIMITSLFLFWNVVRVVAGIVLVLGLFLDLPVLSIVGSGLYAFVEGRYVFLTLHSPFFSILLSILQFAFFVLLIIAFADKKSSGILFFIAGGLLAARFVLPELRSLIVLQHLNLSLSSLLLFLNCIPRAASAFLLGASRQKAAAVRRY